MEYRQLGGSGLKVPVLSLGTASMGGSSEFFKAFGGADVSAATRLVDICLEAGVTNFLKLTRCRLARRAELLANGTVVVNLSQR